MEFSGNITTLLGAKHDTRAAKVVRRQLDRHFVATSVTGDYVYRGQRFPELQGAYVFGDFESRRMWAARFDGDRVREMIELTKPSVRISSFGQDNAGELYFLEGVARGPHAGASSLVGEDGEVVDEVRVFGPTRRDECLCVPNVFVVDPGDDVVEPDPHLEPKVGVGAGGRVPGSGKNAEVAEGLDLLGGPVRGDVQLPVGVVDEPARPRKRLSHWSRLRTG